MKLHEYQAKELLAKFGVSVPKNAGVAASAEEAVAAAKRLGGRAVVKAQVHTGGRGKAGGIRLAETPEEAGSIAQAMLGSLLRTHQAPQGLRVDRVLIEAPITIEQEYYAAIAPDRNSQRNVIIVSAKGGMDIEAVAEEDPAAIARLAVDPLQGLDDYQLRRVCWDARLDPLRVNAVAHLLRRLYTAYLDIDGSLMEVNPLAMTGDGKVLAADAKVQVDDSSLFRHPDLASMAEESEEDPIEADAHRKGIAYVRLGGDVGIICNGAGLTMATMDAVQRAGGRPADFLDVGGGAQAERVKTCLGVVLSDPNVRGILINIFGGITRCDEVAKGVIEATRSMEVGVPIVVRLAGTRAQEGQALLAETDLKPERTMQDAAARIVSLVVRAA